MGALRHAIKNKSPKEGTKTVDVVACICRDNFIIKNKSPKEGTKTAGDEVAVVVVVFVH